MRECFRNGGSEAGGICGGGSGVTGGAVDIVGKPGGATVLLTVTAGSMIGGKIVNNPGAWGNNIRLGIDYSTTFNVPDPSESVSELFNLTVVQVDPATGQIVRTETFRNLTLRASV